MKKTLAMILLFGMVGASRAEEIKKMPAPSEKNVEVKKAEVEPAAPPKTAPAAESEKVAVPAVPAALPASPPAEKAPEVPKETSKAPVQASTPEVKPLGCVIHLKDLVGFHEKEMDSLKKMIERWNDKVGATIKRRQDLEQETLSISKEIDELQKADEKKSKKEIVRLNKQILRINKDIKAIGKELKVQCKELSGELKEVSKENQAALKEKFQQVINDIRLTEN